VPSGSPGEDSISPLAVSRGLRTSGKIVFITPYIVRIGKIDRLGEMAFLFCEAFVTSRPFAPSHGQDAWATNGIEGRTRHMRKEALILAAALLCLNVVPGRSGAD
jgi:hypothetical protein